LKAEKTQTLVKGKVQEYCHTLIPSKLALDKFVEFNNKRTHRDDVMAHYKQGTKKLPPVPLSFDPEGVNEKTAQKNGPGVFVEFQNNNLVAKPKTTQESEAAWAYFKARSDIPPADGWRADTVDALVREHDKAAASAAAKKGFDWNKLSLLTLPKPGGEYKIHERLGVVKIAIGKYPELFPSPPPPKQAEKKDEKKDPKKDEKKDPPALKKDDKVDPKGAGPATGTKID
jgi:hypothetical protein